MSVIIIGTGGGGHNAMQYLIDNFSDMKADEKVDAAVIVASFVEMVNERFGQKFDTTHL